MSDPKYTFPSDEWVIAYKDAINASEVYAEVGKEWTHGPMGFIVKAEPSIGLEEDKAFIVDLDKGACLDACMATNEEAKDCPFCITGSYANWKSVLDKKLDPIKGMMQGKLKLKGNLPIVVRFVKAAQELVNCTTKVNTHFYSEEE